MKTLLRFIATGSIFLLYFSNSAADSIAQSDPMAFVIQQTELALAPSTTSTAVKTVSGKNLFKQDLGSKIEIHDALKASLENAFGTATKTRPGVQLWEIRNPASRANMSTTTKIMLTENSDAGFEISVDNRKGGNRNNPRKLKKTKASKPVKSPGPITSSRNPRSNENSDRD